MIEKGAVSMVGLAANLRSALQLLSQAGYIHTDRVPSPSIDVKACPCSLRSDPPVLRGAVAMVPSVT